MLGELQEYLSKITESFFCYYFSDKKVIFINMNVLWGFWMEMIIV